MVAAQTFDSIIQQTITSNLNFQLQMSPFSATISLKKTPIKDRSGTPIYLQPSLPPQVKTGVIESKNDFVNLDSNANQQYNFPFPPPGFPIPQLQPQSKAPPYVDTKHAPH